MKNFLLLTFTTVILLPIPLRSDTNHFGEGGVFELDLSDSEIPMTPQVEKAQKKIQEEQFKKKRQ